MVAYLKKSEGSEGFHQIIDFLSTSYIKYALTENLTIYASLIENFWQTAALRTIKDGVMAITATSDRNVKVLIIVASIRRHLKLGDSEGLSTLPTEEIFQQLALIGGSLSLNELTVLCTSLSIKVQSLENELHETKKVYSSALTKPILRVKKSKRTVKTSKARRKVRIVISEDEDAKDPSKQRRSLIEELNMDVYIFLVPPHATDQGRKSDDTQVSGQFKDQLGVFSAAKVRYKGKEVMQESEPTKKIKKRIQVQMSIDEELARKLHKKELERFNAEQEAIDIARKEKVVAKGDQAHDIDWSDPAVIRYHSLQNRPRSVAEVRKSISKRTVQEVERQSTKEEKGKKSDDSSKPTRKKTLARKSAGGNDSRESVKKQKLEDDTEKKELKGYLDIVLKDEFVMEVESLAT
nr:hypothetical protein [Tanacetum cinerariifolium]